MQNQRMIKQIATAELEVKKEKGNQRKSWREDFE